MMSARSTSMLFCTAWIGKAFGNAVPVGLVGDLFANGREVYWLLVFCTCARSSAFVR